ncbi:DUF2339 domain-containing protein [Robiginitalea sp. IMCC43444]|uniref:DUF2339 domain-containing protein n=1 Tax=Robiginitalea sp. IMCC43444 TaxID=3459121 RepID=UPI004041D9D6
MNSKGEELKQLEERLNLLVKQQAKFTEEIKELQKALADLRSRPKASENTQKVQQVSPKATTESTEKPARRFYRLPSKQILGGVCAGLSEYTGINLALMRLIWILFALVFCIGAIVYLFLWVVVPSSPIPAPKRSDFSTSSPKEQVISPASDSQDAEHARTAPVSPPPGTAFNLEKYIGESLISKIGVVILIIGFGIGAKYSIEKGLISPLVRVILGYLTASLLLLAGVRLRVSYEKFSAVLVSGAMALFYFVTYIAYTYYDLWPQTAAFALMVLFTIGTVYAALKYDQQIIAHIGMVGAYAVPFLLSEGKGQAMVLFSYIAIINLGILFIALRKYWKLLSVFSFGMTWLIFFTWYVSAYELTRHESLAWLFLTLFFLLFYCSFLAYKLLKKETFNWLDVFLLLGNAFLFYGIGYDLLQNSPETVSYLGAFTLLNAVIHGCVGLLIYRQRLADRNVFYLLSGLAMIFLTISIPVQLDGNWVTLLWMGEAVLLFWIGRKKQAPIYEQMAYPLIVLAVLSLVQDWGMASQASQNVVDTVDYLPFFNVVLLSSLLCAAGLAFINYLFHKVPGSQVQSGPDSKEPLLSYSLGGIFLLVLFTGFAVEISNYWNQVYAGLNPDLLPWSRNSSPWALRALTDSFKAVWLLIYSFTFFSGLSFLNISRLKSQPLGSVTLLLQGVVLLAFFTTGLYSLSELREAVLSEEDFPAFLSAGFPIGIRYLVILFLVLLLYSAFKNLKRFHSALLANGTFDLILALCGVWLATSELLHWLDISGAANVYKLWISILWGVYALLLVGLGIWKRKKHLRVAAIALFAFTLLKLFFYDIAHLNTLSKTVVFVSLGILLLVVSYLYNRFKEKL